MHLSRRESKSLCIIILKESRNTEKVSVCAWGATSSALSNTQLQEKPPLTPFELHMKETTVLQKPLSVIVASEFSGNYRMHRAQSLVVVVIFKWLNSKYRFSKAFSEPD